MKDTCARHVSDVVIITDTFSTRTPLLRLDFTTSSVNEQPSSLSELAKSRNNGTRDARRASVAEQREQGLTRKTKLNKDRSRLAPHMVELRQALT